jgi:hypothetical protein
MMCDIKIKAHYEHWAIQAAFFAVGIGMCWLGEREPSLFTENMLGQVVVFVPAMLVKVNAPSRKSAKGKVLSTRSLNLASEPLRMRPTLQNEFSEQHLVRSLPADHSMAQWMLSMASSRAGVLGW